MGGGREKDEKQINMKFVSHKMKCIVIKTTCERKTK